MHRSPFLHRHPPFFHRVFAVLLAAAVAPVAVCRVLRHTIPPLETSFELHREDVLADLVDGEVAAG